MKDFRDLKVWEKAHEMTLAVYKATSRFPAEERFGLTSQMRRACVSIPSNIAEGCGKDGDKDFKRFLQIAMGSGSEVEYQFLLARDLEYLDAQSYQLLNTRIIEVKRMLASLINKLKS